MTRRLPFRQKLTVWSILVAAVALLICALVEALFVHFRELGRLDADLETESSHFFRELELHGGTNKFNWGNIEPELREWLPRRHPPHLLEISTGGTVRWRSPGLPAGGIAAEGPGKRSLSAGEGLYRVLVTERDGARFAVAADLRQERKRVWEIAVLATLVGLPFALAFAWLGGRKLASMAVGPVVRMTEGVERMTAENLGQRVPVPPVADELQRHALALNRTFDRLERSYQQAIRFSSDASHELRTPLTVMRTSIEAVLDSPSLGENERAAVSGLLEQTRRLTNITSSLLLLARSDAGKLNLEVREQDLAGITEACVEDARIAAEPLRIEVESTLEAPALARVEAIRYAQIVSNLLDNAVKYNRPGGRVEVNLCASGAEWQLSVGNTGPGIPPSLQPHLFERFYRAEHTAEKHGHGLGLSLSRELARAHGGSLALVKSDADWTEFRLTLPISASQGQAKPESALASS